MMASATHFKTPPTKLVIDRKPLRTLGSGRLPSSKSASIKRLLPMKAHLQASADEFAANLS
jgi:hypothetical protein